VLAAPKPDLNVLNLNMLCRLNLFAPNDHNRPGKAALALTCDPSDQDLAFSVPPPPSTSPPPSLSPNGNPTSYGGNADIYKYLFLEQPSAANG
jgi:hypothetical protein